MGKFTNSFMNFVKKNDTNILTGVGIADGLFLGGYLWYRTGQKVKTVIDAKENELKRKLTFKEKVSETWKIFILPSANTVVSAGTLIYSAKVGNKKLAALGAAYNLTEVAFQKYIDKTKEEVGEKKAEAISQSVSSDDIKSTPSNVVVLKDDGEVLFREPLTDRYFKSTWEKIQKAANEINSEAISGFDGRITLSDWFLKLGLPPTDISDDLGWDVQNNGPRGIIDISPDADLDDNNKPCGVIRYRNRPRYFD